MLLLSVLITSQPAFPLLSDKATLKILKSTFLHSPLGALSCCPLRHVVSAGISRDMETVTREKVSEVMQQCVVQLRKPWHRLPSNCPASFLLSMVVTAERLDGGGRKGGRQGLKNQVDW